MDKKCIGCGVILQNLDKEKEGYITKLNSDYCERCFRIKNYGDYKNVIKDNETFISILKNIDKNDLVVLVMDLFNMPEHLDLIKENITNDILVVLTKRDILPKVIYEERLLSYIDNYHINYVDKVIVSSNKNYNFDELIYKINMHKKTNKVYVVGYTNAGKSTLINKLLYNYSESLPTITTSMLPSTTLNSIEIKFDDKTTFIDTPGLLSDGSIENIVDVNLLKKINPKLSIKPITYQIKSKQYIIVEDILKISLENNNITIFMSNALRLDRLYKDKQMDLDYTDVIMHNGEDLVIPGLGFIKFTRDEKINVGLLKGVKFYKRKSLV